MCIIIVCSPRGLYVCTTIYYWGPILFGGYLSRQLHISAWQMQPKNVAKLRQTHMGCFQKGSKPWKIYLVLSRCLLSLKDLITVLTLAWHWGIHKACTQSPSAQHGRGGHSLNSVWLWWEAITRRPINFHVYFSLQQFQLMQLRNCWHKTPM